MTPAFPTVAGYQIERLIGRGGMASVYLATQQSLGRKVALKIMEMPENAEYSGRFLNEGRLIAALKHKNVITIHDVGTLPDGRNYIAMEYVEGGDLESLLGKPMDPQKALSILRESAECLAYVHEKGIVHRDIKPANILFRSDGSLVITDFGVAKQLDIDVKLTQDGHTMGSPAYTSPEQAQCHPLDGRTDIYALGVVFAEMLLGHNHFHGDSYLTTTLNHVQGPLPALPKPLARYQALLNRMLAKNPEQRLPSAKELLASIDRLQKSLADHETRTANGTFLKKARPWLAAGLVIAVVATPAGFWLYQKKQKEAQVTHLLDLAKQRFTANQVDQPANDNAIAYYRQALALDPRNGIALAGLDQVTARYVELARKRLDNNRWLEPENDSALTYYQKALALDKDNAAAKQGFAALLDKLSQRGFERLEQKRWQQPKADNALYYFQQVLALDPKHAAATRGMQQLVDAYVSLAEARMKQGQLLAPENDSARYYYQQIQLFDAGNAAARQGLAAIVQHIVQLGNQRLQEGKLLEPANNSAVYFFRLAQSMDAGSGEAKQGLLAIVQHLVQLGDQRYQEGKLLEPASNSARYYYKLALSMDAGNEAAQKGLAGIVLRAVQLGDQRLQEGKLLSPADNSAMYYYKLALSMDAGNGAAKKGLVAIAGREAQLGDQRLQENKLLEPNEDSSGYYYQQALSLDPQDADARRGLNALLDRLGNLAQQSINDYDYDKSMAYIRGGLALDPDNARLHKLEADAGKISSKPKQWFQKVKNVFK